MAATPPLCDFGLSVLPSICSSVPTASVIPLDTVRGENGLLVMFICNHCPYVKAVLDKLVRDAATRELTASARWRSAATTRRIIPRIRSPTWLLCRTDALPASVSLGRDAVGGQSVRSGVHARFLRLQRQARAAVSRTARRCGRSPKPDAPRELLPRRWSRSRAPAKARRSRRRASAARSSGATPPEGTRHSYRCGYSGLQKKLAQRVEHGIAALRPSRLWPQPDKVTTRLSASASMQQRRVRRRRHQVTLSQHQPAQDSECCAAACTPSL